MQTWKRLPEHFGPYEVSDRGEVRNYERGTMKKQTMGGWGYYVVGLWKDGKGTNYFVHRLVALAFLGEPIEKPAVNHIDGIKTNNAIGNLEYLSRGDNMRHAHRNGLCVRGSRAWNAKLDEEMVRSIRERVAAGERQSRIAREIGISSSTMSLMMTGKKWRHVV